MSSVVRFKTANGDEMIIIPAADYQQLVDAAEAAADVAAFDRAKQRLASGEDEMIPSEIVDRLLSGESRLKVWREHRGLSSKALAEKAGIAQGFLSQIETGRRDGTVASLGKLADALGVTIDDLAMPDATEPVRRPDASISQLIVELVARRPGLTEAEIAAALFGGDGYQQKVNGDCRRLIKQSRAKRRGQGGSGDPYRYYPVDVA